MQLYQFNFKYLLEEDRLLFSITTTEQQIVTLLLTRRFVSRLVTFLDPFFEKNLGANLKEAKQPLAEDTKEAMAQFEHEQALQSMDFDTPFDESKKEAPLGDSPLLIKAMNLTLLEDQHYQVSFISSDNQAISLNVNVQFIHSFYHALSKVVEQADWGLFFKFKTTDRTDVPH